MATRQVLAEKLDLKGKESYYLIQIRHLDLFIYLFFWFYGLLGKQLAKAYSRIVTLLTGVSNVLT